MGHPFLAIFLTILWFALFMWLLYKIGKYGTPEEGEKYLPAGKGFSLTIIVIVLGFIYLLGMKYINMLL